ncbi:hypothetical protein [Saccharopolyspora sp. ASAGF58]|uniref:hypothetical protein n=1 Tax=Saccharopolyspora sp. ASAGF58 TaxID=2719023 RepID=UPI001B311B1D|nr:hypothetical protein [Saccharopolyspora sp. ASAGF58]
MKANTLLATLMTQRAKLEESGAVPGTEWEKVEGSIAAVEAELAAIENDDMGSGATARGNEGADREAPAGVVELVGLVGRVEGHLSLFPEDFRPDLHDQVEKAWAMAKKGSWTRGDPPRIDSKLAGIRELERWLSEVVRSPGVVELVGLVGRLEGHLSKLPAGFRPDVRAMVAQARAMAQQGSWTPEDRRLAGMRKVERWLAEVVSSPGVVEFVGLVGRLEGHLSKLPAGFRPDVRAGVAQAKAMAQKGNWTPEELLLINSQLERMRERERWLDEVVRSSGVVELGGLVERVEGHLSVLPADVLLDVRAMVVQARAMAQQGSWTPEDRRLAGMRKVERWLAEVVSSPGVVEFVGLVERLEGHLSVLSAGFRPDVRAGVVQARAMAQKGNWTRRS